MTRLSGFTVLGASIKKENKMDPLQNFCQELVNGFISRYCLDGVTYSIEYTGYGEAKRDSANLILERNGSTFTILVGISRSLECWAFHFGHSYGLHDFLESDIDEFQRFLSAMGKDPDEYHQWLNSGCFDHNDDYWESSADC